MGRLTYLVRHLIPQCFLGDSRPKDFLGYCARVKCHWVECVRFLARLGVGVGVPAESRKISIMPARTILSENFSGIHFLLCPRKIRSSTNPFFNPLLPCGLLNAAVSTPSTHARHSKHSSAVPPVEGNRNPYWRNPYGTSTRRITKRSSFAAPIPSLKS